MADEDYMLETKDLCYKYEGNTTCSLENINMKIKRGVKTVLLGANGAGKSTLFYHFNGVFKPESGTVFYNGKPLSYRKKALRQLCSEVAVVLQNPGDQIFCPTVEQDVGFGLRNMRMSPDEIKERVDEALMQTGMTMLRDRGTLRLSYGQRKRLAFAGAIAMRPKLLIMDEPTAGLDPQMAQEVMELADQLHHMGTTVVISTHDVDLAYAWADEINVLRRSQLIYSGSSEGFYDDRKLVHTAGLMPPSMFSINMNYERMVGSTVTTYPKTVSQLVSKMTDVRKEPGRLYLIDVNEDFTEERLVAVRKEAGEGSHTGVYGVAARKAIFIGHLSSDYVYNCMDLCLSDIVRGNNAIVCCDSRFLDMVREQTERMSVFGTDIEIMDR